MFFLAVGPSAAHFSQILSGSTHENPGEITGQDNPSSAAPVIQAEPLVPLMPVVHGAGDAKLRFFGNSR
jgi:hypothetical protein